MAEKELKELDEEKNRLTLLSNVNGTAITRSEVVGVRRPKQDDDDDETDTGTAGTASTGRPVDNVPFQMGLIPQVR